MAKKFLSEFELPSLDDSLFQRRRQELIRRLCETVSLPGELCLKCQEDNIWDAETKTLQAGFVFVILDKVSSRTHS